MIKPSITAAIFTKDKKQVLLIKRRDVPVWVLPGGGMEMNESPEEAIIREVKEETGFDVSITRKVGVYHPINRLAKLTYLYECEIYDGSASNSDETKDVRFFPLTALPKYLPPPYEVWIDDAKKNLPQILEKKLTSVNYFSFFKHLFFHPILVIRFLLSRAGLSINSR